MQIRHPLFFKTLGLLAAPLVRAWMGALDYKLAYSAPDLDPAYPNSGVKHLYLFWHEYLLYPLYIRGHCHLTMLLSRHPDANIVQELADRFGYKCVRGSTNRGGARAIRELKTAAETDNLCIAADGPRGPRRELALGPMFIASRLHLPVVLVGFGYEKPWRINSWDRFALPRPGSRVRGIFSEPFLVPPRADREMLEHYRLRSQETLTALSVRAEEWACSDRTMENEHQIQAGPKASIFCTAVPE